METHIKERLDAIRARMPIDRMRLDEECVHQAAFYAEVGELVSELKRDYRVTKDRADYVAADLRHKARTNPGSFGIMKVTNDAIQDAVTIHPEYIKAQQEFLDAQYLAECASVLLVSAEQRKSMVKDAVSLFVHEYYSTRQDMTPEKNTLSNIGEEDITNLRRRNATNRETDNSGENVDE